MYIMRDCLKLQYSQIEITVLFKTVQVESFETGSNMLHRCGFLPKSAILTIFWAKKPRFRWTMPAAAETASSCLSV
jgi:hypothetical protein